MTRKARSKTKNKEPDPVEFRAVDPLSPFATHRSLTALGLASLLLLSLIFEPIGWWPLAFVCLVPWLLLAGGASLAPRVYFHSYLLGLAFFLINMRWLHTSTATVIPNLPFRIGWGYLAFSAYLAAYFPVVAIPLRHVVRRRRWPLALALPIVWTGSEMLRAVVISGFPWFFLSHSLHDVLPLIQVSDLVGAYGVTFMVAAVNGAVADVIFATLSRARKAKRKINLRDARFSLTFAAALVVLVTAYGLVQLARSTTQQGPKIAILQGDFIDSIYPGDGQDHDRFSQTQRMATYLSMIEDASKEKPDLFLLPESPWIMFLNPESRDFFPLSRQAFAELQSRATRLGAYIVTGSASLIRTPDELLTQERRHNSATVFSPDGSEPGRYDKVHTVYFGETVPFRFGRLRFLYYWLNRMMPFSGPDGDYEYSIFPGTEFRRFTMDAPAPSDRPYRFAIPICYEDVMPYVSREFTCAGAGQKQIDFLLNISNDGWFGRGIQQPQHLAICVFRAVENRIGIARAVNTGDSAFIQPNGRVHDRVTGDPSTPWPGNCGYTVAKIGVDSRFTFYSRNGDWFAWGCAIMWLALFLDYWVLRARTHYESDH